MGYAKLVRVTSSFGDMDKIYSLNDEAFPRAERIPSERFFSVLTNLKCDILAAYDTEEYFVGFCVVKPDLKRKIAYIFYLAVVNKIRGMGWGSDIISGIKSRYSNFQIVLDLEQLDKKAENYKQRKRRIKFYEKNGFSRSGIGLSYYGVDYEIMCSTLPFKYEEFISILEEFKEKMNFKYKIYPLENDEDYEDDEGENEEY